MPYKKLQLPKKLIAIALCTLLMLTLLPTTALAADCTIDYDANNGTGGTTVQIIPGSSNVVLSAESVNVNRLGHTFQGWSGSPDGSVEYFPGDPITVNSSITLYAVWEWDGTLPFDITYDANGGAGADYTDTVAAGAGYTVLSAPDKGITRNGYTFTGWNTSPDGSGTSFAEGDQISNIAGNPHIKNGEIKLYAQWALDVVNSVTVAPKTASVLKGRTQPFTAIVNVDGGADSTVTWNVNSTLSTIDSAGWLSVSPDETATTLTVTATSTFDTTKKDTATVTVREPVDTVYYFTTDFGTYTGQSEGLTGVIDANISAFTGLEVNGELLHGSNYSTNAGSTIITLYPSYLDTLDNGTYTVRALFTEGYAEGSFTVNRQDNAVSVTGVALDKSTAALTVGKTVQLTATVSPSNATNKGLTWASSDTSVATVDANGNVKGVKSGAATITVTTDDGGYTATCKMTVTNAADSPQTGDSGNMMLWIITGLSSMLIGLSLLVCRKRQQLKENA